MSTVKGELFPFRLEGLTVNKPELMKQMEASIDEAIRTRMWGVLEVTFRDGEATVLRQERITRLNPEKGSETTHAQRHQR
jgi:hypothetical protein